MTANDKMEKIWLSRFGSVTSYSPVALVTDYSHVQQTKLLSQMKLKWLELQTHYSYIMDKWTKGSYTKIKMWKGLCYKNRDEKSILAPMLVEMKL